MDECSYQSWFLGFFKYCNFFLDNFVAAFSVFGHDFSVERLNIILPVGISFYTFQTLSYTIDVYNRLDPTDDFMAFSVFVSFFPQLVAGPIEKAKSPSPKFYLAESLIMKRPKRAFVSCSTVRSKKGCHC